MTRPWTVMAVDTIFDGDGQKFSDIAWGQTFHPLWRRYDGRCRYRCLALGMTRRVQHMKAVLGLPERIRNPDYNTVEDLTLEHGAESFFLFRFISKLIHANQSEEGIFSTQNNTTEMLRRQNVILNIVDVLLHAIEDQGAPPESAPSTPAAAVASPRMLDQFDLDLLSSPSVSKFEPSPSASNADYSPSISDLELPPPVSKAESSDSLDPGTGLSSSSSPLPPHHSPEDDGQSPANSREENFPAVSEIRAAIPPQGVTTSQLSQMFKGRTAGRTREFINMVRESSRYDNVTKILYPKD